MAERVPDAGRADRPCDEVEKASIESFPASDSPSFTPVTHTGAPAHDAAETGHDEEERKGAS